MTRYLVSTVRRRCPPTEPSGYIYLLNNEKEEVIQRSTIIEPLFRELDTNPRGGMRGAKGIAVRPDQIALANFSMIFRYDPQWNLLGVITHPCCAGVHDILFQDGYLWVAAARTDLLLKFDLGGRLLHYDDMRHPSPAKRSLGWSAPVLLDDGIIRSGKMDFRHPLQVEKETYDRAHVNSVCFLNGGDRLVSLGFVFNENFAVLLRLKILLIRWGIWTALQSANRFFRQALGRRPKTTDQSLVFRPARAQSALVRVNESGQRVLAYKIRGVSAPSHSLLSMPDGTVVYLNTSEGTVLHFDPIANEILSNNRVAEGGFLRGVTLDSRNRLLIGNRNELITYDWRNGVVVKRWAISRDDNEAVYDIKTLPPHFHDPPRSFMEHFQRQTGFENTEPFLHRWKRE